jgi:hypothetical protein
MRKGAPVEGRRHTYSDDRNTWWNIRIPKGASKEPQWNDYNLSFPLDLYAEAIGCTGWDWKNKVSRWVGFDFDAISGHAAGVGVSDGELARIRGAAEAIPWVEVRRSTRGAGLHLYVRLAELVPTATHTEHAALSRAILGAMSQAVGFDFSCSVDTCGGVLWIWHVKATPENRGLELLKAGEPLAQVPINWRDHLDVITGKRSKVRLAVITGDSAELDGLASSRHCTPLDEEHRSTIEQLTKSGFSTIWVPDHHLLQTHTVGLSQICTRGVFRTNSEGNDPGQPNCFAFPMPNGGWKVYRFSTGTTEAPTWTRDGKGWTWCYFNREPDLATAAKAFNGVETRKGWSFSIPDMAAKTCSALGQTIDVPALHDREILLTKGRDGRLGIEMDAIKGEETPPGFSKQGRRFIKILGKVEEGKQEPIDADEVIRVVVTAKGENAGHCLNTQGQWQFHPASSCKRALQFLGHSKDAADRVLGAATMNNWQLVTLPFQPEYPGGRRWNRNAPQLRYQPAAEPGPHPHWDTVLDHVGHSLTPELRNLDWAKACGIRSGGDYMRALFACIIRDPFEPTPYLFCYGPENSGKSIVWESFELLVTSGVVKADRALTNTNDFNGELANAILCVVEEKNISKCPGALEKIKDAVTAKTLSIRALYQNSYSVPNSTHWAQFSNHAEACPIRLGDSRITVCHVEKLQREIPKALLLDQLRIEAPAFLRTLFDLELPTPIGRLRLPVVETEAKRRIADSNTPASDRFLQSQCYYVPGSKLLYSEVWERFQEFCGAEERQNWSEYRFSRALPNEYPSGKYSNGKQWIGNISWEPGEPQGVAWVKVEGMLRRAEAAETPYGSAA